MTDNMGRGILAPRSNSQIQDGAREMRTLGRTTAAAISDLDRQVNGRVGQVENLSGVNRTDIAVWRQATAEIQNKIDEIEQNLEPGEDGKDGDPGPPGPGGSIALEETDPGCFVDSEITWMQWPQSGGLPAVWNPNTETYENPITVDTSVGTRVYVGDTMIYGDTGWRDIRDLLPEFWEVQSVIQQRIHIRRENNTMHLVGRVAYVDTGTSHGLPDTIQLLPNSIPNGFRSSFEFSVAGLAIYYTGSRASSSNGQGEFVFQGSNNLNAKFNSLTGAWRNDNGLGFSLVWQTDDPWPTSLPGTPA